jgi:hypothetical protein
MCLITVDLSPLKKKIETCRLLTPTPPSVTDHFSVRHPNVGVIGEVINVEGLEAFWSRLTAMTGLDHHLAALLLYAFPFL